MNDLDPGSGSVIRCGHWEAQSPMLYGHCRDACCPNYLHACPLDGKHAQTGDEAVIEPVTPCTGEDRRTRQQSATTGNGHTELDIMGTSW